jgi:DNA-directed RNA polymerase subunit M/transcription elongation factor TFIIS
MAAPNSPDIFVTCSRCATRYLAHKDQMIEQLYTVCTQCGAREDIRPDQVEAIRSSSEFPLTDRI